MSETIHEIALYDDRPFFETALRHGVRYAIIPQAKLAALEAEAPKGIVQIASTFGSQYLRPEIELARKRIVNLASLYLLETSRGDLDLAAKMIRDQTFLSLSRGGSGLLKTLFAMPEYALLGREQKGKVEEFLEIWSLKDKPQEYRNLLAHRQANALEIEAATWFAHEMDLTITELQEDDVEAAGVIRTALLKRLVGDADTAIANQVELASLFAKIRKEFKSKAKRLQLSDLDVAWQTLLVEEIPSAYHGLSRQVLQEMIVRDLSLIFDAKRSLDHLVFELKERYFVCAHEVEDTSDYDALVSKEWFKLSKGKTDVDSLLTLFLCVAAEMPPKVSLPEKSAKTAIRRLREQGLNPEKVVAWIKTIAPFEKQEGLIEDWEHFCEDAQVYLMDDWDGQMSGALRFLSENCHIVRAKS